MEGPTDATGKLNQENIMSASQSSRTVATPVTVDNFTRAESDLYFRNVAKEGGLGKFAHRREPAAIDNQTVIRLNRDTLYSSAIFDLDASDVTITLPDPGTRFLSLMVVNQDHYVPLVAYGAGRHTLTKAQIGTRYAVAAVRTFVDPASPDDVRQVHALQDAITVQQKQPGTLDLPQWDPVSQKKVRDALLVLGSTMPDFRRAFGARDQVDPIRHLICSALGWGGNPDKDAIYLNVSVPNNDGKTPYKLVVRDVPVDGFWSVSVYNAEGYFQKNPFDAYALNNVTAAKGADGSIAIQFGGCDGKVPNCLPTVPGWNYTVRLYRPRAEILDGSWAFPDPQPIG